MMAAPDWATIGYIAGGLAIIDRVAVWGRVWFTAHQHAEEVPELEKRIKALEENSAVAQIQLAVAEINGTLKSMSTDVEWIKKETERLRNHQQAQQKNVDALRDAVGRKGVAT